MINGIQYEFKIYILHLIFKTYHIYGTRRLILISITVKYNIQISLMMCESLKF